MVSRRLVGWMNGQKVGSWTVTDRGVHYFDYAPEWMASPEGRPLSLSLPFVSGGQIKGAAVESYFDNLLPDGDDFRKRIQIHFGTRSRRIDDLLAAVGQDCVGALQLLRDGAFPVGHDDIRGVPQTDTEIEHHLLAVAQPGIANDGHFRDLRISVAGAQAKTALLRHHDQWMKPIGATPTTHLLKLPMGMVGGLRPTDLFHSVENEWLCSRILAAFGLPVAETRMARFGKSTALIVTRFDRQWTVRSGKEQILRLPQEDFCQATGTPSARKYESDGGPGMRRIVDILHGSTNPIADKTNFLRAQFVFWLMAAIDGHAKNFSLFLRRGGTYRLTPLYDVTSAWPLIAHGPNQLPYPKATLAMALRSKNAHRALDEIHPRHWQDQALRAGLDDGWGMIKATAEAVPRVLATVESELPGEFPFFVWNAVKNGMTLHKRKFDQANAGS